MLVGQRLKLGIYVPFNSQGHIGMGPQHCYLWGSNPHKGDRLRLDVKLANSLGHRGPLPGRWCKHSIGHWQVNANFLTSSQDLGSNPGPDVGGKCVIYFAMPPPPPPPLLLTEKIRGDYLTTDLKVKLGLVHHVFLEELWGPNFVAQWPEFAPLGGPRLYFELVKRLSLKASIQDLLCL